MDHKNFDQMKSTILLLLITVLFNSCNAQVKDDGPKLAVEGGVTHDFGKITHAQRPEHRFSLRNISDDTVRIVSVKASCGCTAAVVSGSTLPPGAVATVDVQFTPPRTTNGRTSKSISVYTEGDVQKMYLLRVEAEIQSSFTVEPKMVQMDTLITRNAASATLRLTNVSKDTQRISMVQGALAVENRGYDGAQPPQVLNIDDVKATPEEFILAPGAAQEITVRFFPLHEGKLMGSLVIYAKDESRQVEFTGFLRRP